MSTLTERIQPALDIREQSLEATARLKGPLSALQQNVMGVPRSCGLLTEAELNLTEKYDATSLVSMLANGEVSAESLLTAFRKRATIAQQCVSPFCPVHGNLEVPNGNKESSRYIDELPDRAHPGGH